MRIIIRDKFKNKSSDSEYCTETLCVVIKQLRTLFGLHMPSNEEIYQIISTWDELALHYQNNAKIKTQYNCTKKRTENILTDFKRSESLFSKNKKNYSVNTYDDIIPKIQEDIKKYRLILSFIAAKQYQFNQDSIMLRAVIDIFTSGEKLGLKAMVKSGDGGRGNKNRLLEFARIITGIEEKKILQGYYKKYKKLKKDFCIT